MIKFVALYNVKEGRTVEEVEKYLNEAHFPLVRKLPGLRKFESGRIRPSKKKPLPYYRVSEMWFDNMDALRAAFASPQEKEIEADTRFYDMIDNLTQFVCEDLHS